MISLLTGLFMSFIVVFLCGFLFVVFNLSVCFRFNVVLLSKIVEMLFDSSSVRCLSALIVVCSVCLFRRVHQVPFVAEFELC